MPSDDVVADWPDRITSQIGQAIKRRRKALALTAQDVAEATTALGHCIGADVLANLETGRRKNIPVTDLIALATVLRTAPALLVCPLDEADAVEILPGTHEDVWSAYGRFVGEHVRITLPAAIRLKEGTDGSQ